MKSTNQKGEKSYLYSLLVRFKLRTLSCPPCILTIGKKSKHSSTHSRSQNLIYDKSASAQSDSDLSSSSSDFADFSCFSELLSGDSLGASERLEL